MTKRYILLDPRRLSGMAAGLDRAFPPLAPPSRAKDVWELLGSPWFVRARLAFSLLLMGAALIRLLLSL